MNRFFAFALCSFFGTTSVWAVSKDSLKPFEGYWSGTCNYADNSTTEVDEVSVELKATGPNKYVLRLHAPKTSPMFGPIFLTWNGKSKRWDSVEGKRRSTAAVSTLVLEYESLWGSVYLSKLVWGTSGSLAENKANFALLYNVSGPWQSATLCEVSRAN